jgi:hypothetical protein
MTTNYANQLQTNTTGVISDDAISLLSFSSASMDIDNEENEVQLTRKKEINSSEAADIGKLF